MNKQEFEKLVDKYLKKECLPDEEILLEKYLDSFQNNNTNWDENELGDKQIIEDRIYSELIEKIKNKDRNTIQKILYSPYFVRIAASIILFITLTTGVLFISGVFNKKQLAVAWNEKSTKIGEKFIVTLMDGTNITLNADSKLKYPMRFGEDSREVYLEGEAYFEVAHDSSKRFIVHSGEITTTVLGTRFNINAFQNEKEIIVSLLEGSVKVSTNDLISKKGDIILSPAQQLVYDKNDETSKVKTFDEQTAAGWKDNVLIFDNEPLEKVLIKLQRTFGVQFELADKSYNNKRIKGNFKNASFWTVAEVIKKATGLQYKTIKENNELKKVVFYKK